MPLGLSTFLWTTADMCVSCTGVIWRTQSYAENNACLRVMSRVFSFPDDNNIYFPFSPLQHHFSNSATPTRHPATQFHFYINRPELASDYRDLRADSHVDILTLDFSGGPLGMQCTHTPIFVAKSEIPMTFLLKCHDILNKAQNSRKCYTCYYSLF